MPGLHSAQAAAPAGAKDPAAQAPVQPAAAMPGVAPKRPPAQRRHAAPLVCRLWALNLPTGQSVQSEAPSAANLPAPHGECCWPLAGGHAYPAPQGLQGSGVGVGVGVRLGLVLGGAEVEPVGVPVPFVEVEGVLEAVALSEMEGVPDGLLVGVREGVPEPVSVGVGEELSEGRAAPIS